MSTYSRLKTFPVEQVLECMAVNQSKRIKRVMIDGVLLKIKSLRLITFFEDGVTCSSCGLKASFFAAEKAAKSQEENYHLNLWGLDENGKEVLFTHDHTLARSLGGKNDRSNTKTMCLTCNFEKSKREKILLEEQKLAKK